jgi:alanyl-tRNA synthetase
VTERLYYTEAYMTRFTARVVGRSDDGGRVYLDRTAFYPTSGGQPNDVGTLAGVAVADVVDEGDRVAHVVAGALPEGELTGEIDWRRRFDHMQQHTGQHLLSAIFADDFGWETVSVHFGADYSTLDLGAESVPASALRDAERRANILVTENRAVRVSFEDSATAAGLRKESDRTGVLRVVSIDALDRSACGGTHVRSTGEIGSILLRRQEKVRKATRVEFQCGQRAIGRARADYDTLSALAHRLSASIDELATIVPAQHEQIRTLEGERRALEAELSAHRARARYAELAPDERGVRRLVDRRATGKADDARAFALAFCALPRSVYVAAVDSPPSLLVAASEDSGVDAGRALKDALGAAGGRGGGSPRLAQGSVPSRDALEAVLRSLGE